MPRNPTGPRRARGERVDTATIAKALARNRGTAIDTSALLAALIDQWGGTTRFARAIFEEFELGKPGGMTRQKVLEMTTRLVVIETNQSIARPRAAADMDDAELEEAIRAGLRRYLDGDADAAPG